MLVEQQRVHTHTRRHTLLALAVLHHRTSCSSPADWTPLSDSPYSSLPSCLLPRVLSICLSDTLRLFVCACVRLCVCFSLCACVCVLSTVPPATAFPKQRQPNLISLRLSVRVSVPPPSRRQLSDVFLSAEPPTSSSSGQVSLCLPRPSIHSPFKASLFAPSPPLSSSPHRYRC